MVLTGRVILGKSLYKSVLFGSVFCNFVYCSFGGKENITKEKNQLVLLLLK